ncbi:hypothetical protein SUGI_0085580 [Cryptomeria japonica]|nr:hypothetical protein SUGI_0085580 [Cryptomeria japonica]
MNKTEEILYRGTKLTDSDFAILLHSPSSPAPSGADSTVCHTYRNFALKTIGKKAKKSESLQFSKLIRDGNS